MEESLKKLDYCDLFDDNYKKFNNVEYFIKSLKDKYNNEDDEYIDKVKEVCCNFEDRIFKKVPRRSGNELD